ncbi:MAG: MAPEG family protein [Methylosarcina sp.]
MSSSIYAALLGFWIVWLSLRVIKLRRVKKISLGDGGDPELRTAIRVQGNAAEYVPISLILIVLLELNAAPLVLIHLSGIAVLIGRLLHARGLQTENLKYRVLGMQLTFYTLIGLAFANLAYGAYRGFQAL